MSNNMSKLTINFEGKVVDIHPATQDGSCMVILSNGENTLKFEHKGTPQYQKGNVLRVTGEVSIDLGFSYNFGKLSVINLNNLGFYITTLHSVTIITGGM